MKIMTTGNNRNYGSHAAGSALASQMAGRILLSTEACPSRGCPHGYRYISSHETRKVFSGVAPGTERWLAVAAATLKDGDTAIKCLWDHIRICEGPLQDAAIQILQHLDRHKANIDEICLLPGGAYVRMRSYIRACAGAMEAGAEELFLSLDGKQLALALRAAGDEVRTVFKMLPYLEDAGYVLHILGNGRMLKAFSRIDPETLSEKEKKTLGSSAFLSSGIPVACETVRACAGNPEAIRLFRCVTAALRPVAIGPYALTENAEKMKDADPCIYAVTRLEGHPGAQMEVFRLISLAGYDRRLANAINRKLLANTARYLEETDGMCACMKAAWVLGRDDVLAFQAAEWWSGAYDGIILCALTNRWDRFLGGLAESEPLREAALYLDSDSIQINANLFSNKQLEEVCRQDLLPQADTVPGWMREATYDQLVALKAIRQAGKEEKAFLAIFEKLSGMLKPEAAAKRMTQFARAWNIPFMGYAAETPDIEETAACLAERDIYAWAGKVFRFKPSQALATKALPYMRSTPAFSEAGTEWDAWFILRNRKLCADGLAKAKEMFCQADPSVQELKKWIQLEDAFYQKYKRESTEFFIRSAVPANLYARGLAGQDVETFRLIMKAAMCGKLGELKYHAGDLSRETGIQMDPETAAKWADDMSTPCGGRFRGTCMEDSTFYGIMTMGDRPFWTCMHYADGTYRECLMSYFDANKKILYRMDGEGRTVARAVLRLTKASIKAARRAKGGLGFVDVEDEGADEYPVMFLERMYSGYQDMDRRTLAKDLLRAARQKADSLGFALVLAEDYKDVLDAKQEGFRLEPVYIYITRSKASSQYLDSFGGMKTYNNGEDAYLQARCLVEDKG